MSDYLPLAISRIEGNSFIHRLHPMTKLIWAIGVVAISFATRNPAVLGIIFILGLLLIAWARVWAGYLSLVLTLFPITLTLIIFQSFAPAFPPPWTPLVAMGPFTIYQEGLYSGISFVARIWAATNFAGLFVLTTHPTDLFTTLQGMGMPHELNFMATASLQLIPIVQREFQLVLEAQRSRGMRVAGFGAVLPSFVPVFAGTIERVQQLAMSLEARAFGSSGKKTSLRQVKASAKDYVVSILGVLCTASLIIFVRLYETQLDWSKTPFMPAWMAQVLVLGAAGIFIIFTVQLYRMSSQA